MRRVEAGEEGSLGCEPLAHRRHALDDPRRRHHRVGAEPRIGRMRLAAGDRAAIAGLALVAVDQQHRGRLADQAGLGRRQLGQHRLDQARDAFATDLLVVGEGEDRGLAQASAHEFRHQRQDTGQEALHVGRTPAVDAPALGAGPERVAGPGLARHRHDVGMPRQHDARHVARADHRPEIGLRTAVVGDQAGFDVKFGQMRAHELDQLEIGAEALGVEPDQAVEQGGGRGHGRSIGYRPVPVIAVPRSWPGDWSRPTMCSMFVARRSSLDGCRPMSQPVRRSIAWLLGAALVLGAVAAEAKPAATVAAIVGVKAEVPASARTADTLGRERSR